MDSNPPSTTKPDDVTMKFKITVKAVEMDSENEHFTSA